MKCCAKRCPNCGRTVRDRALFCLDCGEPLPGYPRQRLPICSQTQEVREHGDRSLNEIVLEVRKGALRCFCFMLKGDRPLLTGRLLDCDFVLADRSVSRRHAVFRPQDGGWIVADLASTNGTFVNGVRVWLKRLELNDIIEIGRVSMIVNANKEARSQGREHYEGRDSWESNPDSPALRGAFERADR